MSRTPAGLVIPDKLHLPPGEVIEQLRQELERTRQDLRSVRTDNAQLRGLGRDLAAENDQLRRKLASLTKVATPATAHLSRAQRRALARHQDREARAKNDDGDG